MTQPNPEYCEGPAPDGFDRTRASPASRLIGAACGAFVFGFIAILIAYRFIEWFGGRGATVFWVSALVLGGIGGFAMPRASHLLGYGFLVFINLMLALTISNNLGEQILLFCIFLFIEFVFLLCRRSVFLSHQPHEGESRPQP